MSEVENQVFSLKGTSLISVSTVHERNTADFIISLSKTTHVTDLIGRAVQGYKAFRLLILTSSVDGSVRTGGPA